MGTPHRVCRTFARLDFILVPLPAAKITAKIGELSDMYPHHSYRSSPRRSPAALLGCGGRIRTCDPGTKTRCLATWLRPSTGPRRLYRNACMPVAIPASSDSDDLHPTGDWLVDADERSINRISCGARGLCVVEDPVDSRSTPAHRGPERT